MIIKEVYVNNFRGIREGVLKVPEHVTVLVGRNGVGKSSILEALYLISACAQARDDVRAANKHDYVVFRRGHRGGWNTARFTLWHRGETEKPIIIKLKVNGGELEFMIPYEGPYSPYLVFEGKLVNLERGYYYEKSLMYSAIDTKSFAGLKDFLKGFLLIDDNIFRNPVEVEKYAWHKVAVKRLDKRIVDMLKREFEPKAEGLTYIPIGGEFSLALQTTDTTVRIDDLGDGARASLLVGMLILAYNPTVLLLEDPEVHMHPGGLYAYMETLLELSKEMGFQIMLTTHSVELIQIIEDLSRKLGLGVSVNYVEMEEGVLKARNFSIDDVEILRKLGIDMRLLHKF